MPGRARGRPRGPGARRRAELDGWLRADRDPTLRRGCGAIATVVMTHQQPLDKRLFDSKYDDVEILGKLVTRDEHWRPIGFVLHVQNGAIFGAA